MAVKRTPIGRSTAMVKSSRALSLSMTALKVNTPAPTRDHRKKALEMMNAQNSTSRDRTKRTPASNLSTALTRGLSGKVFRLAHDIAAGTLVVTIADHHKRHFRCNPLRFRVNVLSKQEHVLTRYPLLASWQPHSIGRLSLYASQSTKVLLD